MSSQISIRPDVHNRPNSFRADAPASAPAPQSIDSAGTNSATKAIRRPMARAERNGEILAIPARGLNLCQ